MPIYEYECQNHHRFELRQSYTDDPGAACPICDREARRLISLVPVHFKGSGFYVTDYARKDAAGSNSNGGASKDSALSQPKATPTTPAESPKASAGKKSAAGEA